MAKRKNQHVGSDFDDFLAEEGLLEDAELVAVKRVLAHQITEHMKAQSISKVEMAKRMATSRSALDRLLEPDNPAGTLQTLGRAAHAVGARLEIGLKAA